jgi:hypothetical protein
MSNGTYRIHFDATLDELVDTNLRLRTRSRTVQGYRTRSVWVAGGALCVALLAVVFIRTRDAAVDISVANWGVLIAVALGLGAVFGYLYGLYYDRAVRRQYRQVLAEQFGGASHFRCEIELRDEGVWVVQKGLEITFPWSNAAGVEDTGDAIELRFTPGIVVARNRAFRDGVDRARFLERARALAGRFATPTQNQT